jgi:hypothetical protein
MAYTLSNVGIKLGYRPSFVKYGIIAATVAPYILRTSRVAPEAIGLAVSRRAFFISGTQHTKRFVIPDSDAARRFRDDKRVCVPTAPREI